MSRTTPPSISNARPVSGASAMPSMMVAPRISRDEGAWATPGSTLDAATTTTRLMKKTRHKPISPSANANGMTAAPFYTPNDRRRMRNTEMRPARNSGAALALLTEPAAEDARCKRYEPTNEKVGERQLAGECKYDEHCGQR